MHKLSTSILKDQVPLGVLMTIQILSICTVIYLIFIKPANLVRNKYVKDGLSIFIPRTMLLFLKSFQLLFPKKKTFYGYLTNKLEN